MKRISITLFLALYLLITGFAQPTVIWQKSFGGTLSDGAHSMALASDGGFVMAGFSKSEDGDLEINQGGNDYCVVKTDANGELEWQKTFGGQGDETCQSVIATSDGGYALSGFTMSGDGDVVGNHGPGLSDFWILKLDGNGDIVWKRCYGGTSYDNGFSIIETSDGGFAFCGGAGSSDGDVSGLFSVADYWLVKIQSDGEIDWQKCLGGIGSDNAVSLVQSDDGGYVLAGESNSWDSGVVTGNHGNYDFWVVKTDSEGELVWQKSFGSTGADKGKSITKTTDGGYAIAGSSGNDDGDVSGFHGSYDFWVIRIDGDGELLWQKSLGGYDDEKAFSIDATTDGGFVLTGFAMNDDGDVTGNHGDHDMWVVKVDATGDLEWQKSLGGVSNDEGYSVRQLNATDYIVAGHSGTANGDVTENNGQEDLWLVKLSLDNSIPIVKNDITLLTVSPNPFSGNAVVSITGHVPGMDHEMLVVSDVSGRTVLEIPVTVTSFTLDCRGMEAGVYSYRYLSGDGKKIAEGQLILR